MASLPWQRLRDRLAGNLEAASVDLARIVQGGGVAAILLPLDAWSGALASAESLLDDEEHGRVARQRFARNREALTIAYALHRLLLSLALQCPPGRVALGRDASGCPRLRDDVCWTSLSHAEDCIAVAIAGAGRVGIDVEPARRAAGMLELEERVAHVDERRRLATLSPREREQALLELWVRKEALLKAAGTGLEREMEDFVAEEAALLPLPAGAAAGAMVATHMIRIDPRWSAALACVPEREPRLLLLED